MTLNEFKVIVAKYDPNVGDLLELIETTLSTELASASPELFEALPEILGARLAMIAAVRVASTLFGDDDDDKEIGEVEKDNAGYEFSEVEFQSAEDHAREADDALSWCEMEFLRGMLRKANYFSHNAYIGQGSDARH